MKKDRWYNKPIVNEEGKPNWHVLAFKSVIFVVFLLIVFYLIKLALGPYMNDFIKKISNSRPIYVVLFVWFVDTFIVPMSVDVLFPLLSWPWYKITLYFGVASSVGGMCGYFLGSAIGHLKIIQKIMSSFSEQGTLLINRYGAWGVVVAALTPLPFSTVSWLTGVLKVPFNKVAIACFARIPRMALYYFIFKAGVSIFS